MTSIAVERLGRWLGRLDVGRVAGLVTLGLVLALAFGLARLTWSLIDPVTVAVEAPPQERAVTVRGRGAASGLALASVAGLHLFGQAAPTAQQAALAGLGAPETRLRLQLRGVVATTPAGQGIALISSESGEERHYLPGAQLPGGATLAQVHGDRVVLRREGRYELLRLPRDAPLSTPGPAAQPAPVDGAGGGLTEARRQQWLQDPTALFETVQIQPVMREGSIRGFAISPRRDAHLFREAGLRAGDVVTSVNGIAVAGMADPTAIKDQLADASELRLDIERDGQPDTIVIPIRP